jgi:hypothetical protein
MTLPEFLVQTPDGEARLASHRIGLLHLVHYSNEGFSAEIRCSRPFWSKVKLRDTHLPAKEKSSQLLPDQVEGGLQRIR